MPVTFRPPRSLSCQLTSIRSKFKNPPKQTLSLLQSCNSLKEFNHLHAQIIRQGQIADPFVATKMLEFCAISGNMGSAISIFHELDRPNAFMWTAMIRGFVGIKAPKKAIEFYDLMRPLGVQPYKFTYIYILKAYSMVGALGQGRTVHSNVVKVRLNLDAYLCSALVNLYSSCGDVVSALKLFEEIPDNNSVIWNAMISGCFNNGDVVNATRLFDEMPERDVTTWNAAISGYSKWGRLDHARELFDKMPERNLLSWSTMISAYVQSRRAVEALNLFQEMCVAGVRPDGVTMATALSACSQIGALDMGKWIHTYLDKNMLWCDVVLGTSLVDMYAKCGCIDLALQVFHGMEHKNVSSWNAMLCGFAMHGQGDDALALFGMMESAGVAPNDITFVGVLSACSHIGAVGEGHKQFDRMHKEFKIVPKVEHYGCMIDLLGRAGLVNEAKDLIMCMPMEPNPVILGAFLSVCKIYCDFDASNHVIKHVIRHVCDLDVGDGGCHVLLSNIYASMNQWEGVAGMRKLMKGMGFQKIPGCSSIEVNSVAHEFVVGDHSHPNWIEVSEVIDRLSIHLEMEGYVPNSLLLLYDRDRELL